MQQRRLSQLSGSKQLMYFIPVKACARTSVPGTRQHFTCAACQNRIPPDCVWNQTQLFYPCQSLYLDNDVWSHTTFH